MFSLLLSLLLLQLLLPLECCTCAAAALSFS
jgi:hypothetical protein